MRLPAPNPELESRFPHRHDRAYAYLRGLLLDGGLEPNNVLSTEDVAKALNVSRAPVTDATKRVARDGFFVIVPQVGCVVCAPKPAEVADFYRLFAKSEATITSMAAERRTADHIPQLRATIAGLEAQFDALRGQRDVGPILRDLNRQRYQAIHDIASSSIAGDLVANMWDRSDFYIRIAYGEFVYARSIQESHKKICRAVLDGNPTIAASETEKYLTYVGREIAAKLAGAPNQ
ncbi:MAG TPA: GntR family transcriptional regulator [Sneathiellales bacterium]|nr:GntR family transcriptional regulator [Sneathiellales bacterium]